MNSVIHAYFVSTFARRIAWPLIIITGVPLVAAENAEIQNDLKLASSGQTDYVIVKPENPTKVDEYAVKTLADFLAKKTGAVFPVVAPEQASPNGKHIFVGLSAPAKEVLGDNPLSSLKPREFVCRSVGDDVFLYGEGVHGNLNATLDFMRNTLGRRWFSCFDQPTISAQSELVIPPFERKKTFSFAHRGVPISGSRTAFAYQQGMNLGFSEKEKGTRDADWFKAHVKQYPDYLTKFNEDWFGVESDETIIGSPHSVLCYIPPHPGQAHQSAKPFSWMTRTNYFETHPEFFSLKNGQRVSDHQVCLGNPELRKEMTGNVLNHLKRENNDDAVFSIGLADVNGTICECPLCARLEERYESPGGPMFDYLFTELCPAVAEKHPKTRVKMIAYFQTKKPPILPPGVTVPDNLIVQYCTVKEWLAHEWTHPRNEADYETFLKWRKLAPRLWVWIYPLQFGSNGTYHLPSCPVQRLVADLRLMKKAGVDGVFGEFNTYKLLCGDGFSELLLFLFCNLTRDVNCDVLGLIKEFTDAQYGPAAPLVRAYRDELEAAQQSVDARLDMWASRMNFKGEHAYLSLENIHRWHGYFDQMETLTANPKFLENVSRIRRTLEFATLARWSDLTRNYPDYFTDYKINLDRLDKSRCPKAGVAKEKEKEVIDGFISYIELKANEKTKPLPPPFDEMNPSRVRRFTLVDSPNVPHVVDEDAAFGHAVPVHNPDAPFNFGFFQTDQAPKNAKNLPKLPPDSKTRWERTKSGAFTLQQTLRPEDVKPGEYHVYELGDVRITPHCLLWFSAQSWKTHLKLGDRLHNPDSDNQWTAYASMKFNGPSHGGKGDEDQVLVDQIILVEKGIASPMARE